MDVNEEKAFAILNLLSGMRIKDAQELLGWCSGYLLNQPCYTWSKKLESKEKVPND